MLHVTISNLKLQYFSSKISRRERERERERERDNMNFTMKINSSECSFFFSIIILALIFILCISIKRRVSSYKWCSARQWSCYCWITMIYYVTSCIYSRFDIKIFFGLLQQKAIRNKTNRCHCELWIFVYAHLSIYKCYFITTHTL